MEKEAIKFIQDERGFVIEAKEREFIENYFLVKDDRQLPFQQKEDVFYLDYKEVNTFLDEEEEGTLHFICQTLYSKDYIQENAPKKDIENVEERYVTYLEHFVEVELESQTLYARNRVVGTRGFNLNFSQLKSVELEINNATLEQDNNPSKQLIPYIGLDRSIRFKLKQDVSHKKQYLSGQKINRLSLKNQTAQIRQQIRLKNVTMTAYNIQLKSRNTSETVMIAGQFYEEKSVITKKNKKITTYTIETDIAKALFKFKELDTIDTNKNQSDDIIDVYMLIKVEELEQPILFRLGKPRIFVERYLHGQTYLEKDDIVHDFVPYFTIKGNNLSLNYNRYTKEAYNTYKKVTRKVVKPKNKRPIWIVGEKSYKAQDTGFRFFKYLRENQPEIDAYYVINKQSNEYQNVKELGNILDFKSPEHFEKIVSADYICTSHHMEHIFPNRSHRMESKIKAKRVFLQHGILGTKNLQTYYHKKIGNFKTDLFVVSSEREKKITTVDLGYDENQVLVTGISRLDTLLDGKVEKKKQILLIPSWREWITNSDKLLSSQYFELINGLLSKLNQMDLKGYQVVFCLHPNMQPFLEYFNIPKSEKIVTISQGERDVQELMKESALMITDYSSVGFDFSFLNRPVLYYQFDRSRFLGKYPSHLDLDNELPGFISSSADRILDKLNFYLSNDCKNDEEYTKRARVFFGFNDLNSSKRIYEQVSKHRFTIKERFKNKIDEEIVWSFIQKKYRRSRMYFPSMKIYYRLIKTFSKPNGNMILFESNVGKTIGDNPKIIYDELTKSKKQYQFVWVSNNPTAVNKTDETIVVKRLSKEYYYYLAKSKYWVNNQNFPSYLIKPKETVYLQTWHGTPLKKMQNDLEVISGRDEDYLERVNKAVSNWDYLVSPSKYASDAFKSAFKYEKEILEVGYPRNDIFYKKNEWNNKIPQIKQKLGLELDNRKIILYAPTFRDDTLKNGKAQFEQPIDLNRFYQELSSEYILLIKPHIITGSHWAIPKEFQDSVKNVTSNDIQELYLITDICITDYSSVMFDFANTKKPLLFFTYDLEHYRENLRGFYMDFEKEAPGPLCMTSEQLLDSIKNINQEMNKYHMKYEFFYQKYCGLEDGHAAEKVVTHVFGKDND